ncbi:Flagellar basal-body P-ring formation protein FlgA [Paramagnetospirillum magnetotacticum MS-1]|uniref:Flagellar basal-body P-ring formation protein FlgA n=1 Tax=Paramagnetospirillum magnetotacticum MS-1 TaxID=272627 RepID=A0A0C2Z032_PARME|nr:flagellar basal body P-ring formation chaperone FlgA [Paramagnetospirillum magnetotacticum]KIM00704.1 Flagellar basal-body P-ring formation protein FlgA [Paramagnetospirillum magnetotacticum MS-1]
MIRRLCLRATIAGLAFAAAFGTANAAELPPQLKPNAVLTGDAITLGDIWENIGDKAGTPLANAPAPGKRITLETRWLMAVAQSYGIDWRPASAFERTVVERAGQSVDIRTIETELKEALSMEGAPAGATIEISNRQQLHIVIPANASPTVAIKDLSYDPRMNRFQAVVESPAGAPNSVRFKVMGSVYASARIPVLAHAMGRGEVIAEADIQWVEVREEVVRRDIVSNPRMLIGQEPRYQLRAGVPVRTNEVQKPLAVGKNSSVTIVLRSKFMTLTAQGRAMEDGSVGDVIRVTNVQSKQTVDARIEGPGQVSVMSGGMRALAHN